jgi:hypothetical protein
VAYLSLYEVNKWNDIRRPIMAMDSANTSEIVMAVKIFGAAEGLRPRALMLVNATAAITPHGPNMHRAKIRTMILGPNIF